MRTEEEYMAESTEQSSDSQSVPAKIKGKYDAITALLEPFCRERLNEEYRVICLRLDGLLARKRPSPLVNGTAAGWATTQNGFVMRLRIFL